MTAAVKLVLGEVVLGVRRSDFLMTPTKPLFRF